MGDRGKDACAVERKTKFGSEREPTLKLTRRYFIIPFITVVAGLTGVSTASAQIFDCEDDSLPMASGSNRADEGNNQQEVWVDGNDSVDIITINPEVALALQDEGDADTEGDGTSVSGGDSGVARQEDNSETNEGCLVHSDDAVDVLTINPEVSATIDDDPLMFGGDDESSPDTPGPASQK
jgi:hypothetical protein